MAKKWRCAVIGVSMVGQTHVRVLSQMPNAKLVASATSTPTAPAQTLEKHNVTGVPIYKDQAEMHAKEQLDVVHIATPSGIHMLPAMLAMEHGVQRDRRKAAGDPPRPHRPDERGGREARHPAGLHLAEPLERGQPRPEGRPPAKAGSAGSPGRDASPPGTGRTSITKRAAGAAPGTWTAAGPS